VAFADQSYGRIPAATPESPHHPIYQHLRRLPRPRHRKRPSIVHRHTTGHPDPLEDPRDVLPDGQTSVRKLEPEAKKLRPRIAGPSLESGAFHHARRDLIALGLERSQHVPRA